MPMINSCRSIKKGYINPTENVSKEINNKVARFTSYETNINGKNLIDKDYVMNDKIIGSNMKTINSCSISELDDISLIHRLSENRLFEEICISESSETDIK